MEWNWLLKKGGKYIYSFINLNREFIENDLVNFARANPGIVVYLQPKRHRLPKIDAEYCSYFLN
jgi:hypothetical protein